MASNDGCSCYNSYKTKRNARLVSRNIDRQLRAEQQQRPKEYLIVIISAPRSESASFITTVQRLYKDAFLKEDVLELRRNVRRVTVQGMVRLLRGMKSLDIGFSDPETSASAQKFLEFDTEQLEEISTEQTDLLRTLWNDSAVKHCFTLKRHGLGLFSSAGYFFDNVERISQPDYTPADGDLVNLPQSLPPSSVKFAVEIAHLNFVVLCIGDLHHKHFHHFEHAQAVIVIMSAESLNIGDEASPSSTNLNDRVRWVKDISQSPWLKYTALHIVVTEKDVLLDKAKYSKLPVISPDISKPQGGDATIEHIRTMLGKACCGDESDQGQYRDEVYTHFVNATDLDDIEKVMYMVRVTAPLNFISLRL